MLPKTKLLIVALLFVCVSVAGSVHLVKQHRLNNQLLQAIQSGQDAAVIRDYINQGADPNATGTSEYDTALFRAIQFGSVSTVQVLLETGASVQTIGEAHTGPATVLACYKPSNVVNSQTISIAEYRTVFQEFERHGESLEERDALGFTPLMRAVWANSVPAAKVLLELGSKSNIVNNQGQTVSDWIEPSNQEMKKLLHKSGLKPI